MKEAGTEEQVILLDENDNAIGTAGKLEAHEKGLLHRAISVFILNSKGEWLLQQRHSEKYHSGALWSNACCSHPRPGEKIEEAAERRLMEEMGIKTKLRKIFHFSYRAEIDKGLTEYEIDHVFAGTSDVVPEINPLEVQDWRYISFAKIQKEAKNNPEKFTVWFSKIMDRVYHEIQK